MGIVKGHRIRKNNLPNLIRLKLVPYHLIIRTITPIMNIICLLFSSHLIITLHTIHKIITCSIQILQFYGLLWLILIYLRILEIFRTYRAIQGFFILLQCPDRSFWFSQHINLGPRSIEIIQLNTLIKLLLAINFLWIFISVIRGLLIFKYLFYHLFWPFYKLSLVVEIRMFLLFFLKCFCFWIH